MNLSKHTLNKAAEITSIRADLDKLRPMEQRHLADDKGDADKVAEALANVRARLDILEARLKRREGELLPLVVADVNAEIKAAWDAVTKADAAHRRAKDEWQATLSRSRQNNTAPLLNYEPEGLIEARKDLQAARKAYAAVEVVLNSVDEAWHDAHRGSAYNPHYVRPDFRANALALVGLPSAERTPRPEGTRVSGLTGTATAA